MSDALPDSRYDEFVERLLREGDNPNAITASVEAAIARVSGWALWGDGEWRLDARCETCGSPYLAICGHNESLA